MNERHPGPAPGPAPCPAVRAALVLAVATLAAGGCAEPPSPALEVIRAGNVVVASTTPVTTRRLFDDAPPALGVFTGRRDLAGRPVLVGCATCHSLRAPAPAAAGQRPEAFHADLTLAHGGLACRACHAPPLYEGFHLADGRAVAADDVITLCSQCHGTQRRDYDHGVHGGMNGYWDEARGARVRNVCTDCHRPHAPRFRTMWPAPGPRDRFLGRRDDGGTHGG